MEVLRLNLGSFTVMAPQPWINLDIDTRPSLYQYASQGGYAYMAMDLRFGLPWPDDRADYIFSSHFLEHVPYRIGEGLIRECKRVLKPGGVMRFGLPDLEKIVGLYNEKTLKSLDKINEGCKKSFYDAERFWEILTREHQACYDWNAIKSMCLNMGFKEENIKRCGYMESTHEVFLKETKDMYPEVSLYFECTK